MQTITTVTAWRDRVLAIAAATLLCFFVGHPAFAQKKTTTSSAFHTPKIGSKERKEIMDALRVPVEKDLKMRVVFVVTEPQIGFRVVRDWVFVNARFVHSDGTPMGKSYYGSGEISDNVQALLHRIWGKWKIVTHVTGASDVEWEDWPKKYHAPAAVIPPMQ